MAGAVATSAGSPTPLAPYGPSTATFVPTGSEVMSRIAAPMVGGMVTAPLLSLFVLPAVYLLLRRGGLKVKNA